LFGEKKVYWYAAFVGLAANNLFIMVPSFFFSSLLPKLTAVSSWVSQGLHCNAGTTAINTLGYKLCSAGMGAILGVIMVRRFPPLSSSSLVV